jgi:hypothetical protein
MKTFDTIAFDYAQCKTEVMEYARLLVAKPSLGERTDILPFFRTHRQLAALCGVVSGHLPTATVDRVAWEYDLFGEYACDLVVGDSASRAYCFIEFEDAKSNSIFTKAGKKAARDWSRLFEHGYSQIVDWIQKLVEMAHNAEFQGRFGYGPITFDAALVIGRTTSLADVRELGRFKWRRDHVVVGSKHIRCFTFDELLGKMQNGLTTIEKVAQVVPKS